MKQKLTVLLGVIILCSIFTFTVYSQEVILPDDSVWGIAWSPDSTRIAVGRYNGTVELRNPLSGQLISTLQSGNSSQILNVVWSPDGTKIAASNENKSVIIWNASNGQILRTLQGANSYNITNLTWSPDSAKVAGISQLDSLLQIWIASTGTVLVSTSHVQQGIDWFQDKLVVSLGNGILILDSDDGSFVKDIGLHATDIISVSWKLDGSQIASGSADGGVKIWSANPSQQRIDLIRPIYSFNLHTLPVIAVDWSPDGTKVASASLDATINVWNAMTGQLLDTIQTTGPALVVAWSPDGTQLAYGGADGTLHIIPAPSVETATPTLREVFNASGCIVSCWEHIQPDVTTTDELESLLEERDIDYILNPMGDGQYQYLWLPENLPYIDTRDNFYEVGVTVVDDVVAEIYIPVNITLSQIVQEYGAPTLANESVSHNGIRDMEMVYPSFGLYFEITSLYGLDSAWVVHVVGENTLPDFFADVPSNIQDCSIYSSTGCLLATATPIPVQTATPIP